jgi:hypothetical protein
MKLGTRHEIDEEIADHLAREAERIVADRECDVDEARGHALRRFGDVDEVRRACVSVRRWRQVRPAAACLLLATGLISMLLVNAPPSVPRLTDRGVENDLYALKRHASWGVVKFRSTAVMEDPTRPAATKIYAAACLVEACRATGEPEDAVWKHIDPDASDLDERPDVAWLVRRLREPGIRGPATGKEPNGRAERRMFRLKRREAWQDLLTVADRIIANDDLTAQTRSYAALCRVEACRALARSDDEAWIAFDGLAADLSGRPDIDWLARRLRG